MDRCALHRPGYIALKLCPKLIIVPSRFPAYIEASKKVQEVLAQYDPNFSAASLDEVSDSAHRCTITRLGVLESGHCTVEETNHRISIISRRQPFYFCSYADVCAQLLTLHRKRPRLT